MKYTKKDEGRRQEIITDPKYSQEPYRTVWRRDCARLIHSPSFRRLQGKSQLFPAVESDFFRNRLTHSLEVAQIAKSIALKLNYDLEKNGEPYRIEPDLVEFAGLAHDLGHPPFGHFGESVLDEKMLKLGGFEGNAQTLRILSTLEKRQLQPDTKLGIDSTGKDKRVGLNLAFRTLASILKYDKQIPAKRNDINHNRKNLVKGYYKYDKDIVELIKKNVCEEKKLNKEFKAIECKIMDVADDIAYSTYDLEDSFKAQFLKPLDLLKFTEELEMVTEKINEIFQLNLKCNDIIERIKNLLIDEVFVWPYEIQDHIEFTDDQLKQLHVSALGINATASDKVANDGYARTEFTSKLVGRFIRKIRLKSIDREFPALSDIEIEPNIKIEIEILKRITYEYQISSPKLKIGAYRAKEIIGTIFDALCESNGYELLPKDFRIIHDSFKSEELKKRTICDFIAGMTDKYAIDFYARLRSVNPQTIFKPFW